jgi:Spy/CpxP family protein refolding chaperone
MKTTTSTKIGTVLMAVLLSAALIPAGSEACQKRGGGQGMNCGMKGGMGGGSPFGIWQNPQVVQDLELTPEQVRKLKEADFALRDKHLPLAADLERLRLEMDQAFAADPVDEKAVLVLTDKISALKGRLAAQQTEARLVMNKILTPAQTEKLKLRRSGAGMMDKPCPMNGQGGGKPCNGQGRWQQK